MYFFVHITLACLNCALLVIRNNSSDLFLFNTFIETNNSIRNGILKVASVLGTYLLEFVDVMYIHTHILCM